MSATWIKTCANLCLFLLMKVWTPFVTALIHDYMYMYMYVHVYTCEDNNNVSYIYYEMTKLTSACWQWCTDRSQSYLHVLSCQMLMLLHVCVILWNPRGGSTESLIRLLGFHNVSIIQCSTLLLMIDEQNLLKNQYNRMIMVIHLPFVS